MSLPPKPGDGMLERILLADLQNVSRPPVGDQDAPIRDVGFFLKSPPGKTVHLNSAHFLVMDSTGRPELTPGLPKRPRGGV